MRSLPMKVFRGSVALVAALWLGGLALPAQSVHVVGPVAGPGIQFTAIQAAVDAAVDGDLVLVRPGIIYAGFEVRAKSLVVSADGPGVALTFGAEMTVRDLAPGQSVTVRGISNLFAGIPLSVVDCVGPVTVQDSVLTGSGPVAHVRNAAAVSLIDCVFDVQFGGPVRPGLDVADSTLFAHACIVSANGPPSQMMSRAGGTGAIFTNSRVFAAETTFRGGRGESGAPFGRLCYEPGNGGDAVVLDGTSVGDFRGCVLLPGAAGTPVTVGGGTCAASPGQVFGGVGTARLVTGQGSHLSAASPVRQGGTLVLDVTGSVGSLALVAISPLQLPIIALPCRGVFHPSFIGSLIVGVGVVSPTGVAPLGIRVPRLGAPWLPLFVQPLLITGKDCAVGTPSTVVLLPPSADGP